MLAAAAYLYCSVRWISKYLRAFSFKRDSAISTALKWNAVRLVRRALAAVFLLPLMARLLLALGVLDHLGLTLSIKLAHAVGIDADIAVRFVARTCWTILGGTRMTGGY